MDSRSGGAGSACGISAEAGRTTRSELEETVVALFDQFRNPILRYVFSIGLSPQDGEDVIQEVFMSLFRHLHLGRSRKNLRGWIFRVAHNLALKKRFANQKNRPLEDPDGVFVDRQPDPSPSVEEQLVASERRSGLLAVVRVLPELDRHCLRLRSEGLRYREIAEVLGISLGSVSMSLTRSLARLERAGGR